MENEKLDINARDRDGSTALILACEKNYASIVEVLLTHKSLKLDIQNKDGHTALILAAVKVGGNVKTVKSLIAKGIHSFMYLQMKCICMYLSMYYIYFSFMIS